MGSLWDLDGDLDGNIMEVLEKTSWDIVNPWECFLGFL